MPLVSPKPSERTVPRLYMHHDLSAKYVDACPLRNETLATPQMTRYPLVELLGLCNPWRPPMVYEAKTRQTDESVRAFVEAVPDERKRADSLLLVDLFERITGDPARMWGAGRWTPGSRSSSHRRR